MDRKGQDLILSVDGVAVGFATTCKVSTTIDTESVATKENNESQWDESIGKKVSEQISFEGYDATNSRLGYDKLKEKAVAMEPIVGTYGYVGEEDVYEGKFLLSQLEYDGTAGDRAKFSGQMKNVGAITRKKLSGKVTRTEGNIVDQIAAAALAAGKTVITADQATGKAAAQAAGK